MNSTTVTLSLPEDIASSLAAGSDLRRLTLEALALEGYREGKLSSGQLRRLLGYSSRIQVHAFLKNHGLFLHYGPEDLDQDREAGDLLAPPTA